MTIHPKFRGILESIAKKGGAEILIALLSGPKKWLELEKIVKEKKSTSYRLKEFIEAEIVYIKIVHDTPTGSKYYALTPIGQKIAQKLKEMQEDYEEYLSAAPPKGKEFLDWEEPKDL